MSAAGLSSLGPDRPFPGLRPFAYADHPYFFGRADQTYALYRMLDRGRFVAVVGSSGSGKSSLVFAGLLPLLDRERRELGGRQWVWRDMSPGDAPLDHLIDLLHNLATKLEDGSDADERFAASQRDRIAYLIRHSSRGLVEALAEIYGLQDKTLVLVVDQFEELFRYATSAQLRNRGKELQWREEAVLFVQLLLTASRDPDCSARFMLTMRSDFIGDCARFQGLPEAVSEAQFLVPALRRDQIEEIIGKPVAKAGGVIDPMLTKRLLTDAGEDFDQLPVLQHCLSRLWEQAGPAAAGAGRHLTLDHYEQIGRMAGALSQHADAILSNDLAGLTPVVAQVFRALSELDREGRAIRRVVPFAQLAAETGADESVLRKVIDRLRADDCSFLRPSPTKTPQLGPQTLVDVGHEALLRRWEKIRGDPEATGEPNDPRPVGWLKQEEADGRRYQALLSIARTDHAGRAVLSPEQTDWWEALRPTSAWAERYGGGYEQVARLIESSRRHERRRQQRTLIFRIAVPAFTLLLIVVGTMLYGNYRQSQLAEQGKIIAMSSAQQLLLDRVLESLNAGSISVPAAQQLIEPIENQITAEVGSAKLTPEIVKLKIRLLVTYADILTASGDNQQASERARQAAAMAEDLVEQAPTDSTARHLAYAALFRVGDAVIAHGETQANLKEGLKYYQRAQAIAAQLRDEKPTDGNRQYTLAFVDNKVGETQELLHKPDEAMKQFTAALAIAKTGPNKAEWVSYAPITMTKIGDLLESRHPPDFDGALQQYQEALKLQQELADQFLGNASILSNMARTNGLIGDALLSRDRPGDFEQALKAYNEAISIDERLSFRDPASALWLGYLASKYRRLARALELQGKTKDALVQYKKELIVRQKLVAKDPQKQTWKKNLKDCQDRIAALSGAPVATGSVAAPGAANSAEQLGSTKAGQ
jgi:tetratricopeptide (TPR) repeat protein